jgi:hypothetical protein
MILYMLHTTSIARSAKHIGAAQRAKWYNMSEEASFAKGAS